MELFLEAEKKAQVSKIEWEQKITEKESQKRISQIEGMYWYYNDIDHVSGFFLCVLFFLYSFVHVFHEGNSSFLKKNHEKVHYFNHH